MQPASRLNIGTRPPSGVSESCIALTAPVLVPVVPVMNKADIAWPKRTSLPSRLPADGSTPSAVRIGLPAASPSRRRRSPTTRKTAIADENRPALPDRADDAAEGEDRGDRDEQQRPDLEEVGPGVGVLERMGGVGVEEAAAVGAELLDDLLARDRPDRDRLLRPFERRRVDRAQPASAARRARRSAKRQDERRSAAGRRA